MYCDEIDSSNGLAMVRAKDVGSSETVPECGGSGVYVRYTIMWLISSCFVRGIPGNWAQTGHGCKTLRCWVFSLRLRRTLDHPHNDWLDETRNPFRKHAIGSGPDGTEHALCQKRRIASFNDIVGSLQRLSGGGKRKATSTCQEIQEATHVDVVHVCVGQFVWVRANQWLRTDHDS